MFHKQAGRIDDRSLAIEDPASLRILAGGLGERHADILT